MHLVSAFGFVGNVLIFPKSYGVISCTIHHGTMWPTIMCYIFIDELGQIRFDRSAQHEGKSESVGDENLTSS